MRRGVKVALAGGVFAVMVGGAGYGAYNLVNGVTGDSGPSSSGPEAVKAGPPTGKEVGETTEKFLAAWARGDAEEASHYTNNAEAASLALTGYREDARLTKVKLTPGKAAGAQVPFSVEATVTYEGKSKPFAYASELTVVRGVTTGRALVDWDASVVHPDLKRGDTLHTGEAAAPPIEAVDRHGEVLDKKDHPSLGPVLDQLRAKYGDEAGGTPGVELYVQHESEEEGTQTLLTLAKGKAGQLETTLSAPAQKAAEKAVAAYPESSVVAVQPSSGEILAVANHRDDGFNAALEGKMAPGSTMKIVSAAMLIDKGVTKAGSPAPCPNTATWQSHTIKNLPGLAPNENATLADSFARSCNTAFVKLADEKGITDESLTEEAQNRFGLGLDWKAGVRTVDGTVPASPGPDRASNMIGQGQVQLNPLNLASVTATAMTGTFRQPVVVARGMDDRELARTPGSLPASTVQQLRQMMNRTAVSGTGAPAMSKLSGNIGAKTGSAEVDGQAKPNSWFTGYRGDVAAAAVAEEGGHGGDTAGPIVAAVLAAGS
ncbi:penicillin-binding transpeptidase domain-containing protein [Streptomyces sp. MZ04]|uniref:penicillin-binding transpeptidase domain-containing protein n=1 Tax=Streptomyces sp. MZ04 TaxID=2559236 RepID=UPI00107EA91C|nr:penicillin-binding transpeptidase domain-containing protein [Streptomyces sp. MZ04]TGB07177.1 penicillin-binding protein [Streptomyces sp. MZ04]